MNELPRAVAPVCYGVTVWLHRDTVQCVINRLVSCLFLCLGRCGRYNEGRHHEEVQKPPSPKGVNPRSRTRLSADLLGARAEKVPGISALLLSHSVDRVGCGVSIHARASPALYESPAW